MGKITFVPVGGLANRMRAMASAVTLAKKTENELDIVWFQDWVLNAPFYRLFRLVEEAAVCLRDASWMDYGRTSRRTAAPRKGYGTALRICTPWRALGKSTVPSRALSRRWLRR